MSSVVQQKGRAKIWLVGGNTRSPCHGLLLRTLELLLPFWAVISFGTLVSGGDVCAIGPPGLATTVNPCFVFTVVIVCFWIPIPNEPMEFKIFLEQRAV